MIPAHVSEKQPLVYICEPEPTGALIECLTVKGFKVRSILLSSLAIDEIISNPPDVVLLDVHFPEDGGYEVCKRIRPHYDGLIFILGCNRDETAQLLAFEQGADDYVLCPASPLLLTAKIVAHLKRSYGHNGNSRQRKIQVGSLEVNMARREVSLSGQPIDMTTMQFELLRYLAERSGHVVARKELYEALHKEQFNEYDRSVDVYISRIRYLLGDNVDNPRYIKTIRGIGYQFVGYDSYSN